MSKPLVFSFVNEQRRFLLLLVGFLTFLTVVSGGIALSISTGLSRFRSGMDRTGIIQVIGGGNSAAAKKIISDNKNHIARFREVDKAESAKLLKNWLKSADILAGYIPEMYEVEAKTPAALDAVAKKAEAQKLRFVYSRNAGPERGIGIKIMLFSGFIFLIVLGALAACITHSVKNIIMIHKREIEILSQIGATTGYVSWQIQKAMFGATAPAVLGGLFSGAMMLFLINGLSKASHVGLLANMGLSLAGWSMLGIGAAMMIVLIVFITSRTTSKILA